MKSIEQQALAVEKEKHRTSMKYHTAAKFHCVITTRSTVRVITVWWLTGIRTNGQKGGHKKEREVSHRVSKSKSCLWLVQRTLQDPDPIQS